ncbi:MAG: ATP-binding protein [Pirellula sp.]|jgi:signal transduction histidine kinase|nr:ATP-binding protein [Pirellula sp.]
MSPKSLNTSKILRSPKSILLIVLVLVFLTEFLVMVALPVILPRPISKMGEAVIDAVLLTAVIAPVLWWLIHAAKGAEDERLLVAREAEALRGQQMATLAQLATGVAHEIRNPLTSVKMLVQVHLGSLKDQGLPTDDMQIVEQEIRRMERSVNSLLEYARPEASEFKPFSIRELLDRTVKLIQGRCESQSIRLDVDLPQSDITVTGDAMQVQQVIVNFCLNAMDVMPHGGLLTIHVSRLGREHSISEAKPAEIGLVDNDMISISVQDTGPGISNFAKDRIYQPFFTTKPNGIGLGLGICQRIAKAHEGCIEATNNPDHGATFTFTLPAQHVSPS